MRFFTPERYLRLGNLRNEQAFLKAHEDWERAIEDYKARLGKIRTHLPSGLRRLVDSVYLHDAAVLGMWQDRVSRLTITLRPESDPSRLVILTYSLAKPPEVLRDALPAEGRSESVAWLYDELDLRRPANSRGKNARSTFLHNILLSNGWEIRLHFHDVKVARPAAIIPLTQTA